MVVLDTTYITLDGQLYALATEQVAGQLRRRRWQTRSIPSATQVRERPDVQPGPLEGEYVVRWEDWSRGCCGDLENLPGCIHYTNGVHGMLPGTLRPAFVESYSGIPITVDQERRPADIVEWGGVVFFLMGRYAYSYHQSTLTQDLDLGAGTTFTDGEVHNDKLIGANTGFLRSKAGTGGAWTTSTEVGAHYLAQVEDRLWRSSYNIGLSNVGPTDNPLLAAAWSANIKIGTRGDLTEFFNGLVAQGERVMAITRRGVYVGDRAAIFPNILPRSEAVHFRDGQESLVRGSELFYVYREGLYRVTESTIEEVGIGSQFATADRRDRLPSTEICALTTDGRHLWAVTRSSGLPDAEPTGVLLTNNNGAAYTSLTATTDNTLGTGNGLAWDTLANQDYLLVGYSAPFYGVKFTLTGMSVQGAMLTAAYVTAAGPPVVATTLPAVCAFHDDTRAMPDMLATTEGTLRNSGQVTWTNRANEGGTNDLDGWTPVTISGVNAYWMRFTVSVGLFPAPVLSELRVMTQDHRAHVWRGRPWQPGDVRDTSIIWEPATYLAGAALPGAASIITHTTGQHNESGALVVLSKQRVYYLRRWWARENPGIMNYPGGGEAFSAKHDGGMPLVDKTWTSVRVKARNLTGSGMSLAYRLDNANAWTPLITNSVADVTEASFAGGGRMIQWRLTFNAFSGDTFPEVYEIEMTFRPRWTYRDEYQMLLYLQDGLETGRGGVLPEARVQLGNLELAQAATSVLLVDPVGRVRTVEVREIQVLEAFQSGREAPALQVGVRALEV